MTLEDIFKKLKDKFQDGVLELKISDEKYKGDAFIMIDAKKNHAILKYLKEEASLLFDNLLCISGVDYKDYFSVVYHLHSYTHLHKVVIKVHLQERENPKLDSTCDLWKGANWLEREIFDILGIHFSNHPDLRRILLPDDWEGYHLRKDYKTQETWHGIKVGM